MDRKNFRLTGAVLAVLLLLTALAGCGGSSAEATSAIYKSDSAYNEGYSGFAYEESYDDYDYDAAEVSPTDSNTLTQGSEETIDSDSVSQKLVYTANVDLQTKDYDNAVSALKAAINDCGGYIEQSDFYDYSSGRDCTIVARIPADAYRQFLDTAGETGNVTWMNESVTDITSSYIDVTARLDSLNEQMERLCALRDTADDLQYLLQLESQISDVQYQIESWTSQLRYMNSQVSYCTVTLSVSEVVAYTEVERDSFVTRFKEANQDSIDQFVTAVQNFIVFLVYLYPYLIIIAVIVIVCVLIHKARKRRMAKVATAAASPAEEKGIKTSGIENNNP